MIAEAVARDSTALLDATSDICESFVWEKVIAVQHTPAQLAVETGA